MNVKYLIQCLARLNELEEFSIESYSGLGDESRAASSCLRIVETHPSGTLTIEITTNDVMQCFTPDRD